MVSMVLTANQNPRGWGLDLLFNSCRTSFLVCSSVCSNRRSLKADESRLVLLFNFICPCSMLSQKIILRKLHWCGLKLTNWPSGLNKSFSSKETHCHNVFFFLLLNQIKDSWLIQKRKAKEKFSSAPVFRVSSGENECIKIFGADLIHSLEDVFLKPFSFSQKK